jgi:hypothetical protein
MNEEQKFPEMDAYLASNVFTLWNALGNIPDTTALSTDNILSVFDALMLKMDNDRVPANGRILYCTHEIRTMLKNAKDIERTFDVQANSGSRVSRVVSRIDEVDVIGVPASLMRTAYDFTEGWAPVDGADQINMFLVHPTAIITPVSYQFSQLDAPSATTQGKYFYYEESFEDVFILNNHAGAIQFNITKLTSQDNTLESLSVGALTLTPTFDAEVVTYTAATTAATSKVKAVAADPDATVVVKLDGVAKDTSIGESDVTITWGSGANPLTVEVTTVAGTKVYTVTVTKT